MKKLSLNGIWQMEGGGFNCQSSVPGSVYSFLLNNNLITDPYFRDNELEALKILENDFTFSRRFYIENTNYQMKSNLIKFILVIYRVVQYVIQLREVVH